MTFKLITRQPGGDFVTALSQASLNATFDAALATALRDRALTDILVLDDTQSADPTKRYQWHRSGATGREP